MQLNATAWLAQRLSPLEPFPGLENRSCPALPECYQSNLDKIALRLNQRPRKTLGFETPASKLQAGVASTG
jgi:hypothetical protein